MVTGAAAGIARAVAERLARDGFGLQTIDRHVLQRLPDDVAAMLPHHIIEAEYRWRGLDAVDAAAQRVKDQCEKNRRLGRRRQSDAA